MARVSTYLGFIALAVIGAELFRSLHDQISSMVAPEYFSDFKFLQLNLRAPGVPERLQTAEVGILASWWMALVGLGGFLHQPAKRMLRVLLWSILVACGFAIVFALCGLAHGYLQTRSIDPAEYRGWSVPPGVALRWFLCAGYTYNAAYLGGALSIPVAWAFQLAAYWFRDEAVGMS